METSNPKSALVDAIKKSTNILVTVAHNPSVDALSAALGFSLILNKIDKHSTAVFSGAMPPAITFLEPEKNFDNNVDSLRDFIIAIDKDKADRLRYKVEGDVVRIYITPYRTNITEKDLVYSQGDFNVDLVIALGVEEKSDLDEVITAHGRILHDATVMTVNTSSEKSSLGTMDWNDDKASSLCEMLVSLSEALGPNLLDEQIATALLTGIVSATDRFSNVHTTPRVMTMSAQLMAAGANQQLIAEKLGESGQSEMFHAPQQSVSDTEQSLTEQAQPIQQPNLDGAIQVYHDDESTATFSAPELDVASSDSANARLEAALGHTQPLEQLREDIAQVAHEQQLREEGEGSASEVPSTDWRDHVHEPHSEQVEEAPLMGGTLNATTNEAEEASRSEERSDRNHTILSHDLSGVVPLPATKGQISRDPARHTVDNQDTSQRDADASTKGRTLKPVTMPSVSSPVLPVFSPVEPISTFPVSQPPAQNPTLSQPVADAMVYEETPLQAPQPVHNQTLADLEAEVHAAAQAHPSTSSIDDARAAVTSAFGAQPISVGGQPTPVPASDGAVPPPPLPPMPDFSTLPPLPPMPGQQPSAPHPAAPLPQLPQTPPAAPAPGQFQIPGAP